MFLQRLKGQWGIQYKNRLFVGFFIGVPPKLCDFFQKVVTSSIPMGKNKCWYHK